MSSNANSNTARGRQEQQPTVQPVDEKYRLLLLQMLAGQSHYDDKTVAIVLRQFLVALVKSETEDLRLTIAGRTLHTFADEQAKADYVNSMAQNAWGDDIFMTTIGCALGLRVNIHRVALEHLEKEGAVATDSSYTAYEPSSQANATKTIHLINYYDNYSHQQGYHWAAASCIKSERNQALVRPIKSAPLDGDCAFHAMATALENAGMIAKDHVGSYRDSQLIVERTKAANELVQSAKDTLTFEEMLRVAEQLVVVDKKHQGDGTYLRNAIDRLKTEGQRDSKELTRVIAVRAGVDKHMLEALESCLHSLSRSPTSSTTTSSISCAAPQARARGLFASHQSAGAVDETDVSSAPVVVA